MDHPLGSPVTPPPISPPPPPHDRQPVPDPPQSLPPDANWMIRLGDGRIFGPFTANDVQNFASQAKLSLDACVQCVPRFGPDWVAVGRVPELAALIRQAADLTHLSGGRSYSHARPNDEPFKINRIVTYISAASFVFAALIWTATIIGIPVALIAVGMATFEIVSATSENQRSDDENYERYRLIGILEIVCGVLTLGNLFAVACGVINLAYLPKET